LVRLVENNDWVILILLGVASVYATIFKILNKDQSLLEYMKLSAEYGGNILMNWIVSGIIYVFVLSVLLFNYISIIPDFILEKFYPNEYDLNRFLFVFVVFSLLYIVNAFLSYLFFIVTGNRKRWRSYVFAVNKFFYFVTIFICLLIIIYYFYPINRDIFFNLSIIFFVFLFLFKIIFLITSSNKVLPKEWYYKFLYICILQILPRFAVMVIFLKITDKINY